MKLEFNGEEFDFDDNTSIEQITHYLTQRKGQMDLSTVHDAVQQGAMMAATTAAMSNLFNTQQSNKEVISESAQKVLDGLTALCAKVEGLAPPDHWDALQTELNKIHKAIPGKTEVDFTGLTKALADSRPDMTPVMDGLKDIKTLLERVLKTPVPAPKKQTPIEIEGFEVVERDASGNTKRVRILKSV